MSVPETILQGVIVKEKKLKELKSTDPKNNLKEINELSLTIRKRYRTLIINHGDYLNKNNKDCNGSLWKSFYKEIDEYRKAIKKYSNQVDAQIALALNNNQMQQQSRDMLDRQRYYLAKLNEDFLTFLHNAILFYQRLIQELEKNYHDNNAQTSGGNTDIASDDHLYKSLYKSLLYLGDLCRYRELYTERNPVTTTDSHPQRDFTDAIQYYERAALMTPSSGNAHNQLAVVATYGDEEVTAVYRYCRSILVKNPFIGGFENLALLYQKNIQYFNNINNTQADNTTNFSKDNSPKKKIFLTKFIRLQGLLFSWATSIHRDYASINSQSNNNSNSNNSSLHWTPPEGLINIATTSNDYGKLKEDATVLSNMVLKLFEQQLHWGAAGYSDIFLVRIIVICIFTIHYCAGKDHNILSYYCSNSPSVNSQILTSNNSNNDHFHTNPEAIAIQFLYGLINKASSRIFSIESKEGKSSKKLREMMNKMLPMLGIFVTWVESQHQLNVISTDTATSQSTNTPVCLSEEEWNRLHYADTELLRMEIRSRSGMRSALTSLKKLLLFDIKQNPHWTKESDSLLQSHRSSNIDPSTERNHKQLKYDSRNNNNDTKHQHNTITNDFLREHIELRGFLPIEDSIEKYFKGFDKLARSPNLMSDSLARWTRQMTVITFINNTAHNQQQTIQGNSIHNKQPSATSNNNINITANNNNITSHNDNVNEINVVTSALPQNLEQSSPLNNIPMETIANKGNHIIENVEPNTEDDELDDIVVFKPHFAQLQDNDLYNQYFDNIIDTNNPIDDSWLSSLIPNESSTSHVTFSNTSKPLRDRSASGGSALVMDVLSSLGLANETDAVANSERLSDADNLNKDKQATEFKDWGIEIENNILGSTNAGEIWSNTRGLWTPNSVNSKNDMYQSGIASEFATGNRSDSKWLFAQKDLSQFNTTDDKTIGINQSPIEYSALSVPQVDHSTLMPPPGLQNSEIVNKSITTMAPPPGLGSNQRNSTSPLSQVNSNNDFESLLRRHSDDNLPNYASSPNYNSRVNSININNNNNNNYYEAAALLESNHPSQNEFIDKIEWSTVPQKRLKHNDTNN